MHDSTVTDVRNVVRGAVEIIARCIINDTFHRFFDD